MWLEADKHLDTYYNLSGPEATVFGRRKMRLKGMSPETENRIYCAAPLERIHRAFVKRRILEFNAQLGQQGTMARHQRTRIEYINVLLNREEVSALLSELCIKLGFCVPPIELERMASAPPSDVDEFTRAVFVAEGLDPVTSDRHLFNKVKEFVARAFDDHRSKSVD